MLVRQLFDEIRVYAGAAERTGVALERAAVRRSTGRCRSLPQLIRKARDAGDGYFYLPCNLWPAGIDSIAVQKEWVVMSSVSLMRRLR